MIRSLALLPLLLFGCNGDGRTQVEGKVHLDGAPLASGRIDFRPIDGKTPTASAEIVNGAYSTRVPQTVMRVEIMSQKVVGKRKLYPTPDSPLVDIVEEAIPAKYNGPKSELKADISGSTLTVDFLNLRSK